MLVKWEDSARPVPAWQWIEDYELPQTIRCISVGYLIAETNDAIALAPKLRAFIADELRAWEKTFPDELWAEFGRLDAINGGSFFGAIGHALSWVAHKVKDALGDGARF